MNKKGFTLVELLVVIAILGALLILALPRITETLNKSRKDVFYNEILEIYKTALSQKQVDNDGKHRPISYCREKGEECDGDYHILELSGTTKVDFIISITSFDKVTHFEARDDRFKFYYDGEGLELENIYVTDIYFADEEIPIDEGCTLKGDVNGDGNITKEDSDLTLNYFIGESELVISRALLEGYKPVSFLIVENESLMNKPFLTLSY